MSISCLIETPYIAAETAQKASHYPVGRKKVNKIDFPSATRMHKEK